MTPIRLHLFRASGVSRSRTLPVLLAGFVLAGCATVGPDYRAPEAPAMAAEWSAPATDVAPPVQLARWWRTLGDPVLERLVEQALEQNLDLRQAEARIDEARALRDRIAGTRLPIVDAGASIQRRRQSENGPLPVGEIPGLSALQTIHDVGFDASWEADLFGGRRRTLEGANARLEATTIDAAGVRMRIAAEVARTWFTAAGASRELVAREASVAALADTLELTRRRAGLGDAARADVDAAEAQWAAAAAALPAIGARRRAAVLGLGVLLGRAPEAEIALLDAAPPPPVLAPMPVGTRADVLQRRPDVLAAERRLAASTADIGVATAELFPKLGISASGGFQALEAGDWTNAGSRRFSVLPFLSWRVFDGGQVRAEIRAREATTERAGLAWEQAVLVALGDAERALVEYHAGLETLARQRTARTAAERNREHAVARYTAGDVPLLELLAADRRLAEAEVAAAQAETAAGVQLVALYKALGGGWDAPEPAVDTRATAETLFVITQAGAGPAAVEGE